MYLFKRGLLPNYFRDMFTLASQIHSYNTRNSSLFYIPHCLTNFRKFSIRFQGPKFFISLSREIQNSESISLFGKRLKKFLLSQLNWLFVELHTFSFFFSSFFFFSLKNESKFSFSTLNLYDLPYTSRKPIVYKPWLLYRLSCLYHI